MEGEIVALNIMSETQGRKAGLLKSLEWQERESTSCSGVQCGCSLAERFPSSLPVCLLCPPTSSSANTSLSHSYCSLLVLGCVVPRVWMNVRLGQKMVACQCVQITGENYLMNRKLWEKKRNQHRRDEQARKQQTEECEEGKIVSLP